MTSSLRVFKRHVLRRTDGAPCAARSQCQEYICSCAEPFQSGCCHSSSLLPLSWQLAAYICLNLSPLSRVQQVNEHTHPPHPHPTTTIPPLNSACRWDESEKSESESGCKNKSQQSDQKRSLKHATTPPVLLMIPPTKFLQGGEGRGRGEGPGGK